MNQQMEALAAANAANVEAMHSLAYTSIKATERLMSLNLDFARSSLRLGAEYAGRGTNADWKQMFSQQQNGLQKSAQEAVTYLRSVYDVSTEAQAEVSEVISSRVDDMSDSVASLLDVLKRTAPPGSEKAMEMLKSAFADTCSAYAQAIKTAPQATASSPSSKRSRKA